MIHNPSLFRIICIALLIAASYSGAVERPHVPKHEFSFVVLGDSQFHLPNTFNKMIDEVVHLFPSFVIQVGDMIRFPADEDVVRAKWKRFKAQIAPLYIEEIPFYPVPGNHDVTDSSRGIGGDPIYREVWGVPNARWGVEDSRGKRVDLAVLAITRLHSHSQGRVHHHQKPIRPAWPERFTSLTTVTSSKPEHTFRIVESPDAE